MRGFLIAVMLMLLGLLGCVKVGNEIRETLERAPMWRLA